MCVPLSLLKFFISIITAVRFVPRFDVSGAFEDILPVVLARLEATPCTGVFFGGEGIDIIPLAIIGDESRSSRVEQDFGPIRL